MINSVGFILIKPQLPENIGFCARGLKNFGFKKLDLVKPKESWPNKKASATSVGAKDVLNKKNWDHQLFLTMHPDGKATVHITKTEMGQHIGTALAQIVAEELEINWNDINIDYLVAFVLILINY